MHISEHYVPQSKLRSIELTPRTPSDDPKRCGEIDIKSWHNNETVRPQFNQKPLETEDTQRIGREVARELGVSPEFVYRCCSKCKRYGNGSFRGNGRPKMTSLESTFAHLSEELTDLGIEGDIRKKSRHPHLPGRPDRLAFMKSYTVIFLIQTMRELFKISSASDATLLDNPELPKEVERRKALEFSSAGGRIRMK